jgi:hypothetical protein
MQPDVPQDAPTQAPMPIAPVPPMPTPAVAQQAVIATCRLQPGPSYDGDALVEIPFGSAVNVLADKQADDHGRPWQQVGFGAFTGWVQVQNLRPL